MKIDRLLGIIIYLLNRNVASSQALAEKFEVSQRTIQRDMDSINQAGIPIISYKGANGGYGISEGYRIDRQLTSSDDYQNIITALKGLCSGYESKTLNATLEKFLSLTLPQNGAKQKLLLDFGVLKEDSNSTGCMKLIEKAIETEKAVEFIYTNADNNTSCRMVEPLILTYKWYAWYLFGYCCERKDYRLFRLSRIRDLIITNKAFLIRHRSSEELMTEHGSIDNRRYLDIKLLCRSDICVAATEAFPGGEIFEQDNGDIIIHLRLPENERMWFAALLSFGDKIIVLEPAELKEKLIEKADEILKLYKQ